jgi:hypothetical protein
MKAEGVAEGRQIFVNLKRSIQSVPAPGDQPRAHLFRFTGTPSPTVHQKSSLNFSVSPQSVAMSLRY